MQGWAIQGSRLDPQDSKSTNMKRLDPDPGIHAGSRNPGPGSNLSEFSDPGDPAWIQPGSSLLNPGDPAWIPGSPIPARKFS